MHSLPGSSGPFGIVEDVRLEAVLLLFEFLWKFSLERYLEIFRGRVAQRPSRLSCSLIELSISRAFLTPAESCSLSLSEIRLWITWIHIFRDPQFKRTSNRMHSTGISLKSAAFFEPAISSPKWSPNDKVCGGSCLEPKYNYAWRVDISTKQNLHAWYMAAILWQAGKARDRAMIQSHCTQHYSTNFFKTRISSLNDPRTGPSWNFQPQSESIPPIGQNGKFWIENFDAIQLIQVYLRLFSRFASLVGSSGTDPYGVDRMSFGEALKAIRIYF